MHTDDDAWVLVLGSFLMFYCLADNRLNTYILIHDSCPLLYKIVSRYIRACGCGCHVAISSRHRKCGLRGGGVGVANLVLVL
jgi:hypothetical protein